MLARLHEAVPDMCNAASKVKIKAVKPILASRRATGSEVTSEVTTTKANQAAVKADLNLDNINKALAVRSFCSARDLSQSFYADTRPSISLIIPCCLF